MNILVNPVFLYWAILLEIKIEISFTENNLFL